MKLLVQKYSKFIMTVALSMVIISNIYAELPDPGMQITPGRTALLITDPQNDFLSPDGVVWEVVGKNVTKNNTVNNIDTLFKTAKDNNIPVFV